MVLWAGFQDTQRRYRLARARYRYLQRYNGY